MSYVKAVCSVRNQIRKFSYVSVLQQMSAYLQQDVAVGPIDKVTRIPWVVERMAVWVLRDYPGMYKNAPMQAVDLRKCIDLAWKLMDRAVTWTKPGNPVDLLMRSLLLAQAPYQMPQGTGAFARQIDVLGRIEPTSKLYKSITEALGMAPLTYLQIAVFFWCSQEQGMENVFTPVYMQSLKKAFGDKAVECFLKTIVFPQKLVASQLGPVSEDEWFQPTPLYRTPYVDYGNQRFNWGRPNVQRHLEFAFSDIISHEQDTVRQAFENAFEQYVGNSLRRTGLQTFNEDEIKKRFKLDGLCNDFAIIDSDVVVLFEAKNKALTHTLPASASAMTYQSKFKATVVKAAAQIDNIAKHVKTDAAFSHANVHRVVVTYGDLMLGSAKYLFENVAEKDVPLVLSIDQVDRLVEAVRLGQCKIGQFFEDYYQRQATPQTHLFSPGQLLEQQPYLLSDQPKHLEDIFNPFFDSITKLVGDEMTGYFPGADKL